jgi:hypothetical protein
MNNALQKKMSKKIYFAFFMILFIVLLIMNTNSSADVTRSCTAKYVVGVSSVSGATVPTYTPFTGKGTVGYFAPNKARERARKNLDECIQAHWLNRNMNGSPSQCKESNQVYNYTFDRGLIPVITIDLCSRNKAYETLNISLFVLFDGDTGCFLDRNLWKTELTTNYRINCPDYEYEPGTDRPGGDYRNFNLDRPDWHLCQSECNRDTRCRAWTYVNPGVQDPTHARCWLKSTVPNKGPSSCCNSGVKIELH